MHTMIVTFCASLAKRCGSLRHVHGLSMCNYYQLWSTHLQYTIHIQYMLTQIHYITYYLIIVISISVLQGGGEGERKSHVCVTYNLMESSIFEIKFYDEGTYNE